MRLALGTVERRANGSWRWRGKDSRTDPSTGEILTVRASVPLGSCRNRSEAEKRAAIMLARVHPERMRTGRQIIFAAAVHMFRELHFPLMRASSRGQYAAVFDSHLLPLWAKNWLHAVDAKALRALIVKKASEGLARETVRNVRSIALHLLRWCRGAGLDAVPINPREIRLPAQMRPKETPRHLTSAELDLILENSEPPWRALFALLGLLGLRISEALAIQWPDIVLAGESPRITLRRSTARGQIDAMKSIHAAATLPLPPRLVDVLREHREHWDENENELLFATMNGRPLDQGNVRARVWRPLLARLGIRKCGLHAARHGLIYALIETRASIEVVRKIARHADVRTTQRYFAHTGDRDLQLAVEAAADRCQQLRPDVTQGAALHPYLRPRRR